MHVRWKVAAISAVAAGGLVGLSLMPQANAAPQKMRFGDLTKAQKRLISGFASVEVDQARGGVRSEGSAFGQALRRVQGQLLLPDRVPRL